MLTRLPALGSFDTSSCVFTKSSAAITAVFPSTVTVALPLLSTNTVALGFALKTESLIAVFSVSDKPSLFATTVSSTGILTAACLVGSVKSVFAFNKSAAGIVATAPSFVVTVAFPLSSTTTVASGFIALTLSAIFSFNLASSSGVKLVISLSKITLSAGVFTLLPAVADSLSSGFFSKSSTGIVAVLYVVVPSAFVSGTVTVAFPLSSTNTFVPSGLTALIAFAILVLRVSLSAPSKSAGFADTLSAGLLTLFPAFAPSA
ncbi:hypothetical protein SMIDD26_00117 [Streptococcus mitis]|uniref:Uncharacterized protein n=1 Tax=Streptococcus mitis TaxID=28037 RepID=A0A139Q0K1_STRMT|nr:hypothetical protein SMIDD26_00117 [Streptococcus mitis]